MPFKSFETALQRILKFRDDRDWKQFHTPKNLAMALSIEASEILELYLWKSTSEIKDLLKDEAFGTRVEEELGDVLIYSLILCHEMGVDPGEAIARKIRKNDDRYPVNLVKGTAKKYDELKS